MPNDTAGQNDSQRLFFLSMCVKAVFTPLSSIRTSEPWSSLPSRSLHAFEGQRYIENYQKCSSKYYAFCGNTGEEASDSGMD